jgi:hypothetical protein
MKESTVNGAPERSEDIIWRRIEDSVVLVEKDGLSMHVLNKTAGRIWELCDGQHGAEEITAELEGHFDSEGIDVAADVRDTISKMAGMGLLKTCEDPRSSSVEK